MSALIIDDNTIEKIKVVIDWAEKHPQTINDLLDIYNNQKMPIGDDPNHVVIIPINFRTVFSIDEYPQGNVRHLSISCNKGWPSIESVKMIMPHFGFISELEDCKVYSEDNVKAINICEKV